MAHYLTKEKEVIAYSDEDGTVYCSVMSKETSKLDDEATIMEIREKVKSGKLNLSEEEILKIESKLKEQEKMLFAD